MVKKLTSPAWMYSAAMVLAVMGLATPAFAQSVPHQHEAVSQSQPDAGKDTGDMKMGEMKKMMAEKMAQKSANADRLAELMAQMKTATGDAKVAAMSEVITLLVQQKMAMEERCATMMKMMNSMKPAP
jgi:hypothetical protein